MKVRLDAHLQMHEALRMERAVFGGCIRSNGFHPKMGMLSWFWWTPLLYLRGVPHAGKRLASNRYALLLMVSRAMFSPQLGNRPLLQLR